MGGLWGLLVIGWVYAFVDRPRQRFEDAAAFWTAVTGTRLSARRGADREFASLLPGSGDSCWKLQGVGGAGGAHLDLAVQDPPGAVTEARRLGAYVVADHGDWVVLRSPAGLDFCVVAWRGEAVWPPTVVHKGGSESRLDQVCLDIGPDAFDAELVFWRTLTGWTHRKSEREFDLLVAPKQPVRILLQRLDEPREAGAHLDIACSDREAAREWHEELGARLVERRGHWLVMTDPAGGTYCLTGRTPRVPGDAG